ncbi:MAG: hypothetical protein ABIH83_04750 [Candidatus Micrarchaeota archaeon]
MAAIAYAIKRGEFKFGMGNWKESVKGLVENEKFQAGMLFLLFACFATFLGSNLSDLALFFLTLTIFAMGIANFVEPNEENAKMANMAGMFALFMIICRLIIFIYQIFGGIAFGSTVKSTVMFILIPTFAFLVPWALGRIVSGKTNIVGGIKLPVVLQQDIIPKALFGISIVVLIGGFVLNFANILKWDSGVYVAVILMVIAGTIRLSRKTEEKEREIVVKADLVQRVTVLAIAGIVGLILFSFAQNIAEIKQLTGTYVLFGAYTEPLYRTIAEQAPGSQYYTGQIGFIGAPLGSINNPSGDLGIWLYSLASAFFALVNVASTVILNSAYELFVKFMNWMAGFESLGYVEKGNSLLTFFVFWGSVALLVSWAYSAYKRRAWALDALIILPFAVPVVLVGFGKQKLTMYLAVAVMFLVCATWGMLERAVRFVIKRYYSREGEKEKEKSEARKARVVLWGKRLAALGVVLLVFFEFGGAYGVALQMPGAENTTPLFDVLINSYGYSAMPLLANSFTPRIYDNQDEVLPKLERYCLLDPMNPICPSIENWEQTMKTPSVYYNGELCGRSLWLEYGKPVPTDMGIAIGYRCSFVAPYWLDSMQWIGENVEEEGRTISWWDYGHWINFFGERRAVLRNEHASLEMIGRTANSFLHSDVKTLRQTMREYDSRYALIDVEILGNGADKRNIILGGKYGALNYLGCAWANKTTVEKWPGNSECEMEHLWEQLLIPPEEQQSPCAISESQGMYGVVAYGIPRVVGGQANPQPKYCAAQEFVNGQMLIRTYWLNETDESGKLKLQKANWMGYMEGQNIILTAYYTKDESWVDENGQYVSGWEDRSTEFYNSNVYSAFFLDELEGFDLVYNSPQIRIFRMKDDYWNSNE